MTVTGLFSVNHYIVTPNIHQIFQAPLRFNVVLIQVGMDEILIKKSFQIKNWYLLNYTEENLNKFSQDYTVHTVYCLNLNYLPLVLKGQT